MKKSILTLGLLVSVNGVAKVDPSRPPRAPRGPDVEVAASYCQIGPFGQIAKAGHYNELCEVMPDAEKCLALIKGQINRFGYAVPVSTEIKERAAYCLSHFAEVLGTDQE